MSKIRIAQRGWASVVPAKTVEEVNCGVGLPWVEIDGYRLDEVISANFTTEDDKFTDLRFTIRVTGPVEVVYVDRAGEPLPTDAKFVGEPVELIEGGEIDFATLLPRAVKDE